MMMIQIAAAVEQGEPLCINDILCRMHRWNRFLQIGGARPCQFALAKKCVITHQP